ncbi:monocarboxylate transporter 12-like [Paramacrobiotus metropolitanus]|uniref:monocarboxylate transporter 12-like n=1 Tax=Paramacrobiotus metropolitanus TaxID=2943436 RepID=UPI0024462B33|nr:monocarboxylate transporter 12-like [Paramacrobiotus metropolitanus]
MDSHELHIPFRDDSVLRRGSPIPPNFLRSPSTKPRSRANSTFSQESDDQSVSTLKPDGGWGWMVVFASFVIQIIADGVANAHGIIFVELLEVYGESKGKTAWVGSVFSGIPLISGPIASALAEQYGCRPITILGGLLAALGFGLSVFATSVNTLCITLGLVSGFGLSLVYVTSMFILVRWFDNKLSFTMGIASAGSGIGMFIFAPFVTFLLEKYELSGTLLLLSGVFLNIIVFGAVMREPEDMGLVTRSCNVSDSDATESEGESSTLSADDLHNMRRCVSLIEIPTFYRQEHPENPYLAVAGSIDNVYTPVKPPVPVATVPSALKNTASPSFHPLLPVEKKKKVRFEKPPPIQRRIIDRRRSYLFGQHHVVNWKRYGFHVPLKLAAMESLSCPDLTSEVDLSQEEEDEVDASRLHRIIKPLRRELRQIRRLLFNVKPLHSPKFVLFCLANLILYLVVDIPCDYATDNAVTHGIDFQKASFLLSIIGIVTTIGQPIYGYLGDRTWCDALVLFAVSIFLCGVATIFVPFFLTYEALAGYSGMFGLFISGSNPLFAVILVDIIDEKYFSSAFGLLYFAQGIATLFGPPLAGFLYDLTGDYDLTFYAAGAGMILASIMLLLFPIVKKITRRRRTGLVIGQNRAPDVEAVGNGHVAQKEESDTEEDNISNGHVADGHPRIYTGPIAPHHLQQHKRVKVGKHLLPEGETAPVHVGTHLLPPLEEDEVEMD